MCLEFNTIRDIKKVKRGYKILLLHFPGYYPERPIKDTSLHCCLTSVIYSEEAYKLGQWVDNPDNAESEDGRDIRFRIPGTYKFPFIALGDYSNEYYNITKGAYHFYRNYFAAKYSYIYNIEHSYNYISIICKCSFSGRLYYKRQPLRYFLNKYKFGKLKYFLKYFKTLMLGYFKSDDVAMAATSMRIDKIVCCKTEQMVTLSKANRKYIKALVKQLNKNNK